MQSYILPDLAQQLLLSVGQMCDSGCEVTFTAYLTTVITSMPTLSLVDEMIAVIWRVNLTTPPSATTNNIYKK
jgi:hypothetical protein